MARFSSRNKLYQELSSFDPPLFPELKQRIPGINLVENLLPDPNIDWKKLLEELESFRDQLQNIYLPRKDS